MSENSNTRFQKRSLAVAVLAATIPVSAYAALEEVIVTANKRAQSANSIGLSIAALSGDKLTEQKLTSLEEITTGVPGLVFATSQQGTPMLTLRGVGFNESSLAVYPATSLYLDEVPLTFPALAAHSAFDLERVEVLKGPQGVLFGQNSTGGAVNFIAAKPTDELSYGADLSYGSYSKLESNAFISAPLTDTIGARLAIQHVTADDWQESVTTNRENGEEDYTAARLTVEFNPSDKARFTLGINTWTDDSDPQAGQFVAATPKNFAGDPGDAALQIAEPLAPQRAEAADWSVFITPASEKEYKQFSGRADINLSDEMTLTGIVAYSDYEQDRTLDGDGSSLSTAVFIANEGDVESTFAEVRLASTNDSLSWVLGANYEDTSTQEDQVLELLNNTSSRPATFFINRTGALLNQEIESYAVFANADYSLTESLTLKLGARYTDTTIDAVSCNYDPGNSPNLRPAEARPSGGNVSDLFNFVSVALGGGTPGVDFTPAGVNQGCFTLGFDGLTGSPFIDTLAEDNTSWRAGVDFQVTDDILTYANVSQGYKAGSYPTLAASTFDQLLPVTQESVFAYEAGVKSSLADNSIQLNAAIFMYDYEDKQVRGKVLDGTFGPLDALVNVPESSIKGAEVDLTAQLMEGLTLTAAVTYIDSEVDRYTGFDVFGVNRDLSGGELPFTPELTYNLDVDYRMSMGDGTLFMGANIVGQSSSIAVFDGDNLAINPATIIAGQAKSITTNYFEIDSYMTVGARIGFESADETWRVMLWGKNVTDEYYYNSVVASSEAGVRYAGRPATFGITGGFKF